MLVEEEVAIVERLLKGEEVIIEFVVGMREACRCCQREKGITSVVDVLAIGCCEEQTWMEQRKAAV